MERVTCGAQNAHGAKQQRMATRLVSVDVEAVARSVLVIALARGTFVAKAHAMAAGGRAVGARPGSLRVVVPRGVTQDRLPNPSSKLVSFSLNVPEPPWTLVFTESTT